MLALLIFKAINCAFTRPTEVRKVAGKEITPGSKTLLAINLAALVVAQVPQCIENF